MTDRYALLGNPVAHSLSPLLHAFFACSLGDDISYERLLVPEGEFAACMKKFFAEGGKGCNVTVPCKLDAFACADTLTSWAEAAGAVNVLRYNDDGTILGDNTDGRGFIADLKRIGFSAAGRRVLLLGAGGAARGVLSPLAAERPSQIVISNRDMSKAAALAATLPDLVQATAYGELDGRFDLIINATSASISGKLPPVADELIAGADLVYDMMYQRTGLTVFLQHASGLGVRSLYDGLGMLVMQAAESYRIWRGRTPDAAAAINAIRNNTL